MLYILSSGHFSEAEVETVSGVLDVFEQACRDQEEQVPSIVDYLSQVPAPLQAVLLFELLQVEQAFAEKRGLPLQTLNVDASLQQALTAGREMAKFVSNLRPFLKEAGNGLGEGA